MSAFLVAASAIALWVLPPLAGLAMVVAVVAMPRSRWFCRWLCPMGLCMDGTSRLGWLAGRRPRRGP
ncbi:MAG TPA: 4Fe-4S binding protein [Phycisphaerales bacterium]|nr:4Fe-4S binding protein [Phycisphaerales bacterium]